MAPILTLSAIQCYRIQPSTSAKPHLFPFFLPTRAIDKEGRSTLRYARALTFCTAQSLGSVSSSYLHPAFRAFFLPVSSKSGLFLVDCPSKPFSVAYPALIHHQKLHSASAAAPERSLATRVEACYITHSAIYPIARITTPLPSRQSRQHRKDCRLDPCKFFARRMS